MDLEITAPDIFEKTIVEWLIPDGTIGYLRENAGPDSLASWIAANIDPTARSDEGLAIFTAAGAALNTPEWREDLLLKARQWETAGRRLAGRSSVLGCPGHDLRVIDEAATLAYIERVAELLRFAEVVYATGSPVEVREAAVPLRVRIQQREAKGSTAS